MFEVMTKGQSDRKYFDPTNESKSFISLHLLESIQVAFLSVLISL